jgi:hypothetical protein
MSFAVLLLNIRLEGGRVGPCVSDGVEPYALFAQDGEAPRDRKFRSNIVLHQHLLDGKLRDIDVAPRRFVPHSFSKSCAVHSVNDFKTKMAGTVGRAFSPEEKAQLYEQALTRTLAGDLSRTRSCAQLRVAR